MNIQLTDEQKVRIYSDRELYPVMRQILLRDNEIDKLKEHFRVVGLATNSILLNNWPAFFLFSKGICNY
jgi:hypothetical protein